VHARGLVEADARARPDEPPLGAAQEDERARRRAGVARERPQALEPHRLAERDAFVERTARRFEQQPRLRASERVGSRRGGLERERRGARDRSLERDDAGRVGGARDDEAPAVERDFSLRGRLGGGRRRERER